MIIINKHIKFIVTHIYVIVRYIFRIKYKIVRLLFRILAKYINFICNRLHCLYIKTNKLLYSQACKTFDLKQN